MIRLAKLSISTESEAGIGDSVARLIGLVALTSAIAGLTLAGGNLLTDGLRKTGQGLEAGAKETGKLTGRGARVAGRGIMKGSKKGVHEMAKGTARGASKIEAKTN